MVAYGIAKARAIANRTDWNERTEITKAVITWFDADYEYELEIENEDRMDNEEFTAWVEENAESLAKADAEENGTTFEEIDSIDCTEKEIDVLPLSGVVLFPPSGFPFPTNAPHRATWGLLFWLVSYTIFCFHLCAEYAGNFVDFPFGLW